MSSRRTGDANADPMSMRLYPQFAEGATAGVFLLLGMFLGVNEAIILAVPILLL